MTRVCPHCAKPTVDEGVRPSVGVDWYCERCKAAGTLTVCNVGRREVTVREMTVPGAPAMRRDWVPAESMPYAERVRPIGGDST